MPEFRESLAHFLYLFWFYHHHRTNWLLLALWADLTDAEAKRTGKGKDGLVQRLDNTCKFKRGCNSGQTDLYPPSLRKSKSHAGKAENFTDPGLELIDIDHTPRAIYLIFRHLRLKLAYLTHTSIQCFTREHWETTLLTIPKGERGKIGLALEFQEYFIVFLSHDLVFQPQWENIQTKLPAPIPPPIYDDYTRFLTGVSTWIQQRAAGTSRRTGLACEVMRSSQEAWLGIGVYTVSEIFFDAGISPFLSEAEVFDCPSRTARLCEAFYAYAVCSRDNLMSILSPCLIDGVLAPTEDQRLRYYTWLHVYAKNYSTIPVRMATLVDQYHESLDKIEGTPLLDGAQLYDVFDPAYIKTALSATKINLGPLIFGEEKWMQVGNSIATSPNPLADMFRQRGLLNSSTYLDLDHYTSLYPTDKDRQRRSTHLYYSQKQIWSITRSSSSAINKHGLTEQVGEDRTRRLFKTIVKRNGVAIGPLEYSGHGTVMILPTQEKKLLITRGSEPQLSEYQIIRQAKQKFRALNNLDSRGTAKVAMTESQRDAQQCFINKALLSHGIAIARVEEVTSRTDSEDVDASISKSSDSDVLNTSTSSDMSYDNLPSSSSPPPLIFLPSTSLSSLSSSPPLPPSSPSVPSHHLSPLSLNQSMVPLKPKRTRKSQDQHLTSSATLQIMSDSENVDSNTRPRRKRTRLV